jgi:acyl-CoA thioesterase-1
MTPSFLLSILSFIAIAQNAVSDTRPVIVAFGDSLTAGYGVEAGAAYPEQLQTRLDAMGYRYRVINLGVTGDTTSQGRARMTRVLATNPSIVILQFGGNDGANGTSAQVMRTNLEQMIATFQKTHITVVLAGRAVPGRGGVYSELANQYHLAFIPLLKGVEGNPALLIGDNVHPNAAGCAIVAETVLEALTPFLKKSSQ